MKLRSLSAAIAAAVSLQSACALAADKTLDYGFFTSRVEPIFLKKREGHARCYTCHSESNNAFRLEKLAAGSKFWTDEQSRKNFQFAANLAVPGDRDKSKLLLQPLAPQAGGNAYHSGGRQFLTKNDPDWKIMAQWVDGQKAPAK